MIERKPGKGADKTAGDDFLTVREGEVAVALPDAFDAALYFIGRIRTPWQSREQCPKNPRESDAICTVELDPRWAPGLKGLETVSHVLLLYWMDRTRRDLVLQVPRHYGEQRGTFALRSPSRPNPIAVSVARLVRVEGNALYVVGVDCLDNTPLLDIKPYFASTDSVPGAVVGWHARHGSGDKGQKTKDRRQRTEDKGQKTKDRRQRTEHSSRSWSALDCLSFCTPQEPMRCRD